MLLILMILQKSSLRKSIRCCNHMLISFMLNRRLKKTKIVWQLRLFLYIKREQFEKSRELVSQWSPLDLRVWGLERWRKFAISTKKQPKSWFRFTSVQNTLVGIQAQLAENGKPKKNSSVKKSIPKPRHDNVHIVTFAKTMLILTLPNKSN